MKMENNIDTQLELAISTRNTYNESETELYIGYSSEKSTWQLLIRYNDDISDLVERYRMQIYYLLAGYAIIEISEAYLNAFAADPRIIYIDKPKSVEQQVSYAQYASCLSGTFINNYGLDGDGTIFAIIDSGIDYRHNEFIRDGKSRILSFWDQQAVYQDTYANSYKLGRIYTNEELNSILDGSYAGTFRARNTGCGYCGRYEYWRCSSDRASGCKDRKRYRIETSNYTWSYPWN